MLIPTQVIGHRGACAYAPENTFASFNKALSLSCKMIEFDVMCSSDGQPFIIHDESLKRTTNGKGKVGLVDAAYLSGLDAGSWFSKLYAGEPIPHFKDALKWLAFSGMQANIEIKPYPGATEQTTTTILSHIHQYWPQNQPLPLLSSFEFEALLLCRSIAPELPLALLLHEWDKEWQLKAKQLECYSIHLNQKILTKSRVQELVAAGYVVCAYTVNRKKLANQLFDWGVHAVFSDYPDLLLL